MRYERLERIPCGDGAQPRTSPYAFQGLGEDGLKMLAEAREATGLPSSYRGDEY